MYAPSSGSSPSLGVGPILVARREEAPVSHVMPEDEDDSLGVVFSANTGAGRAHTPQRLNRTHTPQRIRSSSFLHTAAAPVQLLQPSASKGGGESRRQPLGRRKQRRWENDNLLGVEKFLRGRHAHEEGEAEHLTVSHTWRSSLADLVSDQNKSAAAAEARESIRTGARPKAARAAERGEGAGSSASVSGARRFAGGKWEDAEERFLLVERRLRDIVVRALRSSALLSFVVGLEALLEGFAQGNGALSELPPALRSALASLPTVEMEAEAGARNGKPSSSHGRGEATLLVPLGPSPFHRLLLHALCQYRKLRSRSEETGNGRTVRVTIPTSRTGQPLAVPSASLTEFVLETRLNVAGAAGGGGAAAGGGKVSQATTTGTAVRCTPEEPAPVATAPAAVAGVA